MLDNKRIVDIALELRECEKRIKGLYNAQKDERDKREALLKELDGLMDKAVDNYGRK